MNLQTYSQHPYDEKGSWQPTGYYGYPNRSRRRAAWDFLRQLSQRSSHPWCIFGDFNDIMDASEKRGRTNRSNWLINGFCQAVMDSGTPRAVEERLDNNVWFDLFPSAKLENLPTPASDHYPFLIVPNVVFGLKILGSMNRVLMIC
ncbi:endonuclease/exonuclease/phosphatase family protein [Medicago truncatula]|uniref:Endonuclease/exonuclease/phosphatase family protein n=1 Tax=Medicago truncatula TaxID=3880 RepID=A0A072THT3_MEDTR|nr:endonuclease/exonuclease/phosphatase family protein [Medicago truncatula]